MLPMEKIIYRCVTYHKIAQKKYFDQVDVGSKYRMGSLNSITWEKFLGAEVESKQNTQPLERKKQNCTTQPR